MKALYLLGILLENVYRLFKAMIPAILLVLLYKGNSNLPLNILISIILIGGVWFEFRITDIFKDG